MLACGVPLTISAGRDARALAEAVLKYAGTQKKDCPEFVRSPRLRHVYRHVLDAEGVAEGGEGDHEELETYRVLGIPG